MNGTIINPMWFYLMDVIDSIKTILLFPLIISIGFFLLMMIYWGSFYLSGYTKKDEDYNKSLKLLKLASICSIVFGALLVFLPGQQTMIKMKLAEYATSENIQLVLETIEEMAKRIIEHK